MLFDMQKNVVLITGASSGIGLDLASVAAESGYNLLLTARRGEVLEKAATTLAARYKVQVEIFACDLTRPESADELLQFAAEKGLSIEILINNAGFGTYGFFHETDWQDESDMIMLNIHALTHLTKKVLPGMINKNSGKILNVASTAAFQPGPLMAVYYASKAYVLNLSDALYNELSGTKVTITTLCPGPTSTGFQTRAQLNSSRLMKVTAVSDSYSVARYGFSMLLKGKRVAVPGIINKVGTIFGLLLPRSIILKVVRLIQSKMKEPA